MKKVFSTLLTLSLLSHGYSQSLEKTPPLSPHSIRDADIMWSTRVWREMDLKQKINQPYYFPTQESESYQSLYDVLMDGVVQGDITAYSTGPLGDRSELIRPLNTYELQSILVRIDSTSTPELDNPDEWVQVVTKDSIETNEIMRFRLMEDWIFDKQRSQMVTRIRGLAPVQEVFGEDGESRGLRTLFWLDFEQCRKYLAAAPVYIRHNNNHALSYDDLFMKRFIDARIIKSSNVFDRPISVYSNGLDALLEGELKKEELHNMESDLWDY